MNQGWQCPVCKRVYGPQVTECGECNKGAVKACPYVPPPLPKKYIEIQPLYPTVPQPKQEGYRPRLGGMIWAAIQAQAPVKCPFGNSIEFVVTGIDTTLKTVKRDNFGEWLTE